MREHPEQVSKYRNLFNRVTSSHVFDKGTLHIKQKDRDNNRDHSSIKRAVANR